jgi:hypothetical protein
MPHACTGTPPREALESLRNGMMVLFHLSVVEVQQGDASGFRSNESVAYCAISGCLQDLHVPIVEPSVKLLGVRVYPGCGACVIRVIRIHYSSIRPVSTLAAFMATY